MGQDDTQARRGFLYRWVNEKKTIEAIPCEVLREVEDHEGKIECEVFSRIVGYIRPLRNWNVGKKQEYEDRQAYVIKMEMKDD